MADVQRFALGQLARRWSGKGLTFDHGYALQSLDSWRGRGSGAAPELHRPAFRPFSPEVDIMMSGRGAGRCNSYGTFDRHDIRDASRVEAAVQAIQGPFGLICAIQGGSLGS